MQKIIFLLQLLWKLIKRIIKRGATLAILVTLAAAGNTGCATLSPNGLAWMNSTSGDKNVHGATDDPVEAAAVLSQAHVAEEEQKVRSENAAHCRQLVDRGFKRLPQYCNQWYGGGDFSFYYGGMTGGGQTAVQTQLPAAEKARIEKAEKDAACAKQKSDDALRVAAGKEPKGSSDPDCK